MWGRDASPRRQSRWERWETTGAVRCGQRGVTVVELLVVIAILSLISAGGVYMIGVITHSDLRSEASSLATAIEYTADQAGLNNRQYRMVIDLDSQEYYTEVTEDEVVVVGDEDELEEAHDRGALPDEVREMMEEERATEEQNMSREEEDDPFGISQRTGFQQPEESELERHELADIEIERVRVETQHRPVTQGRVAIHFFSNGLQHRAKIVLRDPASDTRYTLLTEPLTGRVHVQSGEVEVPDDFGQEEYDG